MPPPPPSIHAGTEYELPCPEALLAATLAYMTAHAQGCCEQHRLRMGAKVVDSLATLAEHPLLSPPFRNALWDLNVHWRRIDDGAQRAHGSAPLFHAAPGAMQ